MTASIALPPDRNAADLYRAAGRRLAELPTGTNIVIRSSPRIREALELVRSAATEPDCRFHDPERLTVLSRPDLPMMDVLARSVILDARLRLKQGDLAGTWDDIMVLFRMARHLAEGAAARQATQALTIEQDALDLARDWAMAGGQGADRLRGALAAYRDLPAMTPAVEVVRAEAILTERALAMPSALKDWLLGAAGSRPGDSVGPIWTALWADLITTPWERTRAVRVDRLLAAAAVRSASLEPWQRPFSPPPLPGASPASRPFDGEWKSTPLAQQLFPKVEPYLETEGRNEAARRALVQVLAIRAWQLRHGGQFPDRLDVLVPEELPGLPADPFSGRPFGYLRASQSPGISPDLSSEPGGMSMAAPLPPQSPRIAPDHDPETWLLYSVGPGRQDNRGNPGSGRGCDLVFPIPPGPGDAGAAGPGR
jgi:hypothetical protein